MSPIPPNKDSDSSQNINDPTGEPNNLEPTPDPPAWDPNYYNVNYSGVTYEQLNQEASNTAGQGDDDTESDTDEEDACVEKEDADPDFGFELLASSRINNSTGDERHKISENNFQINTELFEKDFFAKKSELECEEISLDESKSTIINGLMSNFKLPESSIPSWAKQVPENVWKKNLIDSLNAKKIDLFNNF